jgi:predicted kinase
MRRFPQDALLSRMLGDGVLHARHVDALADRVAAFHRSIAGERAGREHGSPEHALRLALDNLAELLPLIDDPRQRVRIAALRSWTLDEHAARAALMRERVALGFVRECHGDLHLANVAMIDDDPTPFDCIEFDAGMRWSDVMSDVAFTAMDFRARGRPDFARRYVNRYLEATGDYAGTPLLPFHTVYRALVRAKVALLRAHGARADVEREGSVRESENYVDLATSLSRPRARRIVVMHGFSGCGKSTLSQALVESADIVRIRMDVERKRHRGLAALARTGDGVDRGLYSPQASHDVYESVAATTETIVAGGQPVVVDAAFLRRWQRDLFRDAASRCDAEFRIVDLAAGEAALKARVARRMAESRDPSDADLSVLEHQLATHDPLAHDELANVVSIDANAPIADTIASKPWRDWLAAIDEPSPPAARPIG